MAAVVDSGGRGDAMASPGPAGHLAATSDTADPSANHVAACELAPEGVSGQLPDGGGSSAGTLLEHEPHQHEDLWAEGAVFTRVPSTEIIYVNRRKRCKLVGHYIFGDLLGEGAYGKVKECIDKDTLERRAVKIFKRRNMRRKLNGEQNLQREIQLLKKLRHQNVLRLYEVLHNEEKQKVYMILEFCVCQLKEMLDQAHEKRFPLWQAHGFFTQLMNGLEYLHSQGVIHNDLKPANLLLTADLTLKISDLGTAEQLDQYCRSDEISISQGSPAFQPPEIASGAGAFSGFKVDVWSSGVTLYNFVTGQYPFEGDTVFKLYDNISRGEFEIPDTVGASLASLLRGMLHKSAEQRFSIAQIKQHEWYRKRQPRTLELVPVPPRNGSDQHALTVLPYIWDKHFGSDEEQTGSEEYLITEHQLNENATRASGDELSEVSAAASQQRRPRPCLNVKQWSNCKQT